MAVSDCDCVVVAVMVAEDVSDVEGVGDPLAVEDGDGDADGQMSAIGVGSGVAYSPDEKVS